MVLTWDITMKEYHVNMKKRLCVDVGCGYEMCCVCMQADAIVAVLLMESVLQLAQRPRPTPTRVCAVEWVWPSAGWLSERLNA